MAVDGGVMAFDGQQIPAVADVLLKFLEREVGVSAGIVALDLLRSLAGTAAHPLANDLDTIQVGDETVVIVDHQAKLCDVAGIMHLELVP